MKSRIDLKVLSAWLIIVVIISGQSKYPADTILVSSKTPTVSKFGILPITIWQRLSYNSNFLNCQFYPSCSNYGAQAIQIFGLIRGSFMTSERIIRCNPLAHHYHFNWDGDYHEPDGRLMDPVVPRKNQPPKKSPVLAALLSTVIPGAGRAYAGRWYEGLLGLWIFSLTSYTAYNAYINQRPVGAPLFIGITAIIYGGEIYGAYRTAKYYQPAPRDI